MKIWRTQRLIDYLGINIGMYNIGYIAISRRILKNTKFEANKDVPITPCVYIEFVAT